MTALAVLAVTVTIGGWLGIRAADAYQRVERDLAAYVLSLPLTEWPHDGEGDEW